MSAPDLAAHAGRIARSLLGEPNADLTTKRELRFGSRGSLAISIAGKKAGTWYCHETETGGGMLDLIARERGGSRGDAMGWIKSIGIDIGNGAAGARRRRAADYIYHDRDGEPLYRVVRWHPKTFTQERWDPAAGEFVGGRGCMENVPRVPYRLAEWVGESTEVWVVEGEKDADKLAALGVHATTNAGGASRWSKGFAPYFDDREVIVCGDNDQVGKKHVAQITKSLRPVARSLRIVWIPPEVGKDISDWLAAGRTLEELLSISPSATAQQRNTPAEPEPVEPPKLAWEKDILAAFRQHVALRGLVGENATAQLLYLAISSRLLTKPVSVGVKGHSSSGKSHTVDRVLEFFPDEAVIRFTSMSERALLYREDDYQHRTLVIYEVTGLQETNEDNMTSYFIRSLLSEGRLEYDVTIRGEGGQYTTQRIIKEGPTNLIFTTTKTRVHAENETRVLSLTTDDGTEQTRNVLLALVNENDHQVDLEEWRQLQAWLQTAEHRVTIPYGRDLAEAVPPLAVRLRRDFGAVLALIKAHAILHQQTRGRDESDRIVATLDDYAAVRELVATVISEGIGAGVGDVVRETVEAVETFGAGGGHGVSVGDIARQLEIDKSNASRRVRRAADGGYIRNLEDKRGKPGRWIVGEPLPETVEVLPQPATLRNAESRGMPDCCAVAPVQEGIQPEAIECAQCGEPVDPQNHTATSSGAYLHNSCVNKWMRS